MAATATDSEVEAAIEEYRAYHVWAKPSTPFQPRVSVEFNGSRVMRRPFKLGGHWRVRWAGTARLTQPRTVDDHTVFTADYGRP